MRTHKRILLSKHFWDVKNGKKKFTIHRESPTAPFWVNDLLILKHEITGEIINCKIIYRESDAQPGFIILGIEVIDNGEKKTDDAADTAIGAVDDKGKIAINSDTDVLGGEQTNIRRSAAK